MPNQEIERVVDGMIQSGRISRDMRDVYIRDLESGLGDHLLRGSDYTNKTKELANARREAEAWLQNERQKVMEERKKLDNWYGQVQGELSETARIREEREALNARLAAAEQALRDYSIYDQVNLPPASKGGTLPPPVNPPHNPSYTPPNPNANPGSLPYLTRDEFNNAVAGWMTLQNKLDRIKAEHQRLFNEPLQDDLITHFQQTGQDPEEHWRVKYAVENRRAEVQSRQREAEIAKIREDLRREIMGEMAVDPSKVMGNPFQTPKGGLTPHLEQYTASRALTHGQNHANDEAAKGNMDFIPPEQRPEIQAAQNRISGANKFYFQHFDINGNPTSEQGRQLAQRYAQT